MRNTLDPKFDARVSFYVTDRTTDAVIQVCVCMCVRVVCMRVVCVYVHARAHTK